ncbi:hypothetical protein B0T10DRAFT_487531 [Thelonectria olida]|uniref:Uncharacterized protein n=1 Tax=Thelonectria olida TaxID=1576542 RepID=A0A9P8W467_9HYPO|nr:hypothetical protein B0T10DRAFT_487531 [Thelonectria olida]
MVSFLFDSFFAFVSLLYFYISTPWCRGSVSQRFREFRSGCEPRYVLRATSEYGPCMCASALQPWGKHRPKSGFNYNRNRSPKIGEWNSGRSRRVF